MLINGSIWLIRYVNLLVVFDCGNVGNFKLPEIQFILRSKLAVEYLTFPLSVNNLKCEYKSSLKEVFTFLEIALIHYLFSQKVAW